MLERVSPRDVALTAVIVSSLAIFWGRSVSKPTESSSQQVQEQLERARKARIEEFLGTAPLPVLVLTEQGQILYVVSRMGSVGQGLNLLIESDPGLRQWVMASVVVQQAKHIAGRDDYPGRRIIFENYDQQRMKSMM